MRATFVAFGLLLIASCRPQAPTKAEEPDDYTKLFGDLTELLKTVKDKTSAEAACPKLEALDNRLAALKGSMETLSAKEKVEQFDKQFHKTIAANKTLEKQFRRIGKLPEVKEILKNESLLLKSAYESLEEAPRLLAQVATIWIEVAVLSYKEKTGEFPRELKALTEGEEPYLKEINLIDPWKQPYQYDPTQLSATGKPRIWTVAPDKKVICNWDLVDKQ
jgi:hypothetical protein